MNKPLLSIGAFSSATQLSAKALRLYADHGILVPAEVDAESGYRYYRPEQVRQARLVRLLRDLDMPLVQIAAAVADPVRLWPAAKQHMAALERRFTAQQESCRLLQSVLAGAPEAAPVAAQCCSLDAVTTVIIEFEAGADSLLARARALLSLASLHVAGELDPGSAFVALPAALSGPDETLLELCIPVSACHADAPRAELRSWPEVQAVTAQLPSCEQAADLTAASDALFDWFDRHGHTLRAAPRLYLGRSPAQLAWPIS